jgi:hypothetical protein
VCYFIVFISFAAAGRLYRLGQRHLAKSHKRHFTGSANHLRLSGFCGCVFVRKIARQNNPKVLAFYMARQELPDKSAFVGSATVIQNDVSNNRCQRTKDIKDASTFQLTI